MTALDIESSAFTNEFAERKECAGASADVRGDGGADDAEFGNGPSPKIKHGPSTMLIQFASHNVRIAIAASPAPRKIALIMKSITTVTFPASMTRVNAAPCSITHGEPPMSASNFGASGAPMTADDDRHDQRERDRLHRGACSAFGFCSPMRRATIAIAPMLKPIASA